MATNLIKLIPDDEARILDAYINDVPDSGLEEIFDALDVPEVGDIERIQIAVANILLDKIQGQLPQWSCLRDDGEVLLNRRPHSRHKAARLNFNPQLIFTLNWADSGPGYSWPEAYYVTYIPGYDKYIITSSRDGDDMYGCSDHAIGVEEGNLSPLEAARMSITENWRYQFNQWDQERWVYLFDQGLVDAGTADAWADSVWETTDVEGSEDE